MASGDYTSLLSEGSLTTAEDFDRVWNHYDEDGNGYIEGSELTSFLREFLQSEMGHEIDEAKFQSEYKHMMDRIDKNKDGKIEMRELAELLLDPKESFLLLFRSQQPISSIEFMKIWRDFDTDNSGYIEVNELKSFMKHLVEKNNLGDISDEKLDDYAKMILKVFDSNNDGKLELKEMAKLLPTKENFLKQFQKIMGLSCCSQGKEIPGSLGQLTGKTGQRKLTRAEFEKVFVHYDTDNNGTIEGDELKGFLKDLMEHEGQQEYSMNELEKCCATLLKVCDQNNDNKIQKTELEMILRPTDCPDPQE